jgi:hypothetical protein
MRTYIDFIQEADVAETAQAMRDAAREVAVQAALGKLDLDAKARLLAGQDMWSVSDQLGGPMQDVVSGVGGVPTVEGWPGRAGGSLRPVLLLVAGVGWWWVC